MDEIRSVDLVAGAVLAVAMLRGVFRGLVREVLSIAGLGAAIIGARLFAAPVGSWLGDLTGGEIGPTVGPWIAGGLIALVILIAATLIGRTLKSGAQAAGLGWMDHAGGAAIGAAEGAIVVAVGLMMASGVIGRDAALLEGTHSLAALEQLEEFAAANDLDPRDVAAPPR